MKQKFLTLLMDLSIRDEYIRKDISKLPEIGSSQAKQQKKRLNS